MTLFNRKTIFPVLMALVMSVTFLISPLASITAYSSPDDGTIASTSYGKNGHYYYEDFETTRMCGPFVHENEGPNVTATLTNRNDPYTTDVISGEKSLKIMNFATGRLLKTLPSTLKLKANTEYTLSYSYKPMYGNSRGWKCVVYSQKANTKF